MRPLRVVSVFLVLVIPGLAFAQGTGIVLGQNPVVSGLGMAFLGGAMLWVAGWMEANVRSSSEITDELIGIIGLALLLMGLAHLFNLSAITPGKESPSASPHPTMTATPMW